MPPFAQDYLKKIPGKKLSLEYVVGTALENAEVYKDIAYDYEKANLTSMAVEAMEDWAVVGEANYNDDNTVKTSPFQPLRAKSWDWTLGFSKNFASGTLVKAGWTHTFTDLEYGPAVLGFGGGFLTRFKQTLVSVNIEQSLLKDFFGYSYRKKRKAARLQGEAVRSGVRFQVENTTLNFMKLFYEAWLKQQRVFSVQKQLKRRERLLKVTQRKKERGVIEKPEYLQVQALVASTRSDLEVARAELRTQWESLVINLKLPIEFLTVDPIDIPTTLDNPMPNGNRACKGKRPEVTAEIVSLEKKMEALQSELDGVKNEALPDLKLVAGYQGNAIEQPTSPELNRQIFDGDGPAWSVGVKLAWPLDNSKNRADRRGKWLDHAKAKAQLRISKDKLKTDWAELCRSLRVERANEKTFNKVVQQQSQRVRAENKRFSLGRVTVDQLVQAEDDLGNWEFRSQQQAISTRTVAWRVQALSGALYSQIRNQVEERRSEAQ